MWTKHLDLSEKGQSEYLNKGEQGITSFTNIHYLDLIN